MRMAVDFATRGKAAFVIGGQWGSEGKGAAAAWLASQVSKIGAHWDVITTNAGAQAGHTSVHKGRKVVVNHLPTAAIIAADEGQDPTVYLNAGSIIDPDMLMRELAENPKIKRLIIHPNAAVIDDECRDAENLHNSPQTKTASTRKGVGQALARKVLRYPGQIAREHPQLKEFCATIDLNHRLHIGQSIFVEVPQGHSLSVNSQFYPYTTSRVCSIQQAMADAVIHPSFVGETMMVLRSYPIRVGNIVEDGVELGHSGGHYADQREITWEDLGVEPEITTVTKRVRRVFTFSEMQATEAISANRPTALYLSFCDYLDPERAARWADRLDLIMHNAGLPTGRAVYGVGPSTDDVTLSLLHWSVRRGGK